MIKRIVFVAAMVLSKSALSFNPDVHAVVTEDALVLYSYCQAHQPEDLPMKLSKSEGALISEANEGMDGVSISRAWNWHFFDSSYDYKNNRPGHIAKGFMGMNRSLHKLFLKRSKALVKNSQASKKRRLLKSTAELMHLIQDMAVPAHVAPIYHVAWHKDPFDSYSPKERVKVSLSPLECKNYIDNVIPPVEILEVLAKTTLAQMKTSINETQSWQDYWSIYPQTNKSAKAGFSIYGKCGREAFGRDKGDTCHLERNQYDKFYNSRYVDAVKSSLRLLVYISKLPVVSPQH